MNIRRICSVAVLALLAMSVPGRAEVFVDTFDTPHDYLTDGVAGTIWDDFFGLLPGETVDALNASTERPGALFMSSQGGVWDSPWSPLGPFLFKVVKGDFIASVRVTDYAGTAASPVYHNDGGLMARAFTDDAGPGEDWISIDYFPIWNCGNFLWQANDGVRNEAWGCNNGKRWDLDPWLQLERKGNTFHVRTSQDGITWTEMSCSPKVRDDLAGIPLMVGLRHATYDGATLGYVAFDDFTLEVIVKPKAYDPVPADGAKNVVVPALTWKPGDYAAQHDVYLGTSFDEVNEATVDTAGIYQGRQDANSFTVTDLIPGTTYYWRIDEVNDANPDSPWKGDVWSFTPVSVMAWDPTPADGATCVLPDADLTWKAGATAFIHYVFFGTDQEAVATATKSDPKGVYKKLQATTSYDPGTLAANTTYYWRIDEVEQAGTLHQGAVWSFTTLGDIAVADAHLVGWWKLEGDCANNDIVVDSSGYNRHGKAYGNPQSGPGYDGQAMQFDGRDDYVELPIGDLIASLGSSTFMTWADFSNSGGAWQRIFDFGNDPNVHMFLCPRKYFIDPMRFAITKTGGSYEIATDADSTDDDAALPSGWHNVAVTIDEASRTTILYLDGQEAARNSAMQYSPKDLGATANNWLGRSQYEDDAYYLGGLDDFRIYDRVLSQDEIVRAMAGNPNRAWNPQPADGSTPDVEHVGTLSWSAGEQATEHDVYFGTDADAVAAADASDATGIYRGRQDATDYALADALDPNQACYWRVDEVAADGTVTKGRVWTFTTAAYLLVDDMESYGGEDTPGVAGGRIWYVWNDGYGWTSPAPGSHGNGTGAMVDLVTTPVRSGNQALRMDYSNGGSFINIFGEAGSPTHSELTRAFDSPQDWTRKGIKTLTLWFYGTFGNSVEPLYVALQDSSGAVATANYEDTNALTEDSWHEWSIDLGGLAGADLSSIQTMSIGVGQAGQAGGIGTLYFDDIRLYP